MNDEKVFIKVEWRNSVTNNLLSTNQSFARKEMYHNQDFSYSYNKKQVTAMKNVIQDMFIMSFP